MKGTMNNIFSKVSILLLVLVLQSCGGSTQDNTVYNITADIDSIMFSNELSQESTESIAINVIFDGEGLLVGFVSAEAAAAAEIPGIKDRYWLSHRTENVTTTSATIYIDVINAKQLAANSYNTELRLTTSNKDGTKFTSHDIEVSLLIWDIAANTEQVNFSATFSDATVPTQTIEITSDNEWTATTDVNWLSLDVNSGNGNASINMSATNTHASESGLTYGNIIFTEVISGQSNTIPVQLALDNIYLYADSPAIALAKTANISAIEKTITISNNSESTITWQATTTADWLTLTPVGNSQLQITADPNLIPTNDTSTAVITVSATGEMSVFDESINVAFYHSDLTVENKLIEPLAINSTTNKTMLASPLLPKFYLAKGNKLETYHQYSTALKNTLLVSPEGTVLEQLVMHPSGGYLLAKANEIDSEVVHRYRINLIDYSIEELNDVTIKYEPIAIVRLSGRYFILTETLEFADQNLALLYWDEANAYFTNNVDMAEIANSLFALDKNNATFNRYNAQINDFGENKILPQLTHSYRPESLSETQFIYDFIVTNDEANIYTISDTSERFSFDGTKFTERGLLENNTDVKTLFLAESQGKQNNSKVNYLRINPEQPEGFYLATYDEQQNLSQTVFTDGNTPNSILLSADSQRLIINTPATSAEDARIELVTLQP